MKKRWMFILRIIISLGLLLWLGFSIEWKTILSTISDSNLIYLLLAFLTVFVVTIPVITKWRMFVNSNQLTDSPQLSFWQMFRYYYIGLFFNNFLPGSVGGDVARTLYLGRQIGVGKATASVLFDRATNGATLLTIILIFSPFISFVREYTESILLLAAIFVMIVVTVLFFIKKGDQLENPSNRFTKFIVATSNAFSPLKNHHFFWWLQVAICSISFQVGLAFINFLLLKSFDVSLSFIQILVIISLISIITMLPIGINGLGVRELSYITLFQQYAISKQIAVSVSLLFYFLLLVSSLIGGLFWLQEKKD